MPSSLIEYRLRIRNASTVANPNGTADALILSSVRGGDNPYITAPPNGDGLEFDPIRGTVRSGSYTVAVADVLLSGTTRVVTSQLVDAQNRQQLISRRAYLEFRVDVGSWQTMLAGYILGIRLTSALTYTFTIGDSRRIEQTRTVFQRDDQYFNIRGTILGGPILNASAIGNIGVGPFVNRGGWKFRVSAVNGTVADLQFVEGYAGPTGRVSGKWNDVMKTVAAKAGYVNYLDQAAAPYVDPAPKTYSGLSGQFFAFPGLVLKAYNFAGGAFYSNATPVGPLPAVANLTGGYGTAKEAHLRADFSGGSTPPVGSFMLISVVTMAPSEVSPMYVSGHPVDIVRNLYKSQNIVIDEASFDALKALQGDYIRYTMRVTSPRKLLEVIEEIAGPFGVGLRVSSSGAIQAFSARIKTTNLPTAQIDTSNLRGDGAGIFDLQESTVVTSVTFEAQTFAGVDSLNSDAVAEFPLDGIVVAKEVLGFDNADVAAFSSKEVKYTFNGMVHGSNWYGSQLYVFGIGVAAEIFDRYGRGAIGGDVLCLRGNTEIDAVLPGDEVFINVAQLPNNGKRLGDDPSVGARIMQVVRRTDTPSGPEFHLIDSGSFVQPPTSPTITIGAGTSPTTTAAFTVTNAATINANGNLTLAVQYAISPTMPNGDGTIFTRYRPGTIPATAVDLPQAPPGSGVWVRARTELALGRPSAWTSWVGVTLSGLAGPSGLSALTIRQTAVTLGWTNTSSVLPVEVFIAPSGTASVTAPRYRVALLPPVSTRFTYRLLSGPGVGYVAAVRYALPDGNGSAATSVSFSTNSTVDTTYRPAAIAIVQPTATAITDSSTRQGIAVALWPSNTALDIEIQRAPDSGGTPGTPSTVALVPGSTTIYTDYSLPEGVNLFWYRTRHVLGGYDATGYTCWKQGTVAAVPQDIVRPGAVAPVVVPSFTETTTTATVSLAVTDPQCRVDVVRFRHRIDGGAWSAWTVDVDVPYTYTETTPLSGFLDIEYEVLGFNAAGDYGPLAGETVAFDRGGGADMVSVVGTFTSTGGLILAFSADSDTQSIKYATSTSAQPSLATVQAQGAINNRNVSASLPGPYTTNTTVFVSVLAYTGLSGTGSESGLFEYRFIRDGGVTYTQCLAGLSTASATQVTVVVTASAPTGTPTVQLVSVSGSATLSSGAAVGVAVASGSTWTFNRGAALGPTGGAQFRAVLAGAQSDDDFIEIPEQGRDTTYLVSRARVISTSNTQVVVRYAVLDRYSALSSSISYIGTGVTTVTPGSPQTVTAAVGDTFASPETVGSYVDFTITRPPFESGAGRVTFTATATGRVADSDAVDVPSQERDTVPLAGRARTLTTTATTQTVRVAVADPVAVGTISVSSITGSTVTVTSPYNQTGTFSVLIAGNTNSAFNGTWTATPLTATTFQISTFSGVAGTGGTATPQSYVTIGYAVAGLATPTQVGGAALPNPVTVTPATSLTEAAGTFYDFQITRPAAASPPGRVTFTVTANGRVSDSDAVDVQAQDLVGPSLRVVTTPSAASYSLVITWDGTLSYSLDGVTQSTAGWVSPYTLVVTRNDYLGATKVVAFSVEKSGATTSETLTIPSKDNNAGATLSIGAQYADSGTNTYQFNWTPTGFPAGTTYNLSYTTTTTSGVVEQGAQNGQTSPVTVLSGFSIGSSPRYTMTVNAILNGVLITTQTRAGVFLT